MNRNELRQLLSLSGVLFVLFTVVTVPAHAGDTDKVGGYHYKIWVTIDGEGGSGVDDTGNGSNPFGNVGLGEAQSRPDHMSIEKTPIYRYSTGIVPMWFVARFFCLLR